MLIYITNTSLDGDIEDQTGAFDWISPDPVHAFITTRWSSAAANPHSDAAPYDRISNSSRRGDSATESSTRAIAYAPIQPEDRAPASTRHFVLSCSARGFGSQSSTLFPSG